MQQLNENRARPGIGKVLGLAAVALLFAAALLQPDLAKAAHGGRGLGYPYDWSYYSPDYGYYGYSQPYSASQYWYYCSDPAGYYPYVTQCNTGWQTVPAS